MYSNLLKPLLDRLFALTGLVLASPVFLLVMLVLAVVQKGKIFFTQDRPGKDERIFKLIKFKTMTDERNGDGDLLPDRERLTFIGEIVRKTSIDELPQLINILNGDMSFIGPRPLLVDYLPLYNEQQRKRHDVKPGISGWAQVNGRNAISWQKKFEYDLYYVKNQSFSLDLKILFLTILKIAKAEGISGQNVATMEKFEGEENKE